MKKQLDNPTYIMLSVGLSFLLCFTAAPFCASSIVIREWNVYVSYTTVCMFFLACAPIFGLLNALSTFAKKNKNIEDIFLNVIFPFEILMTIRVCQYSYTVAIIIWLFILAYAFILAGICIRKKKRNLGLYRRKIFFACRKKIIYLLMFTIFPWAVWTIIHEADSRPQTVFSRKHPVDEKQSEAITLPKITETLWREYSAETKMDKIKLLADYECQKIGVAPVSVYGIKEKKDGLLAYYSHKDGGVYINIIHLQNDSLQKVAYTICHEIYHRYENIIIDSLYVLHNNNFDVSGLEYYKDAMLLADANDNYEADINTSYEAYAENALEVQANQYADKEVIDIADKLGWN